LLVAGAQRIVVDSTRISARSKDQTPWLTVIARRRPAKCFDEQVDITLSDRLGVEVAVTAAIT